MGILSRSDVGLVFQTTLRVASVGSKSLSVFFGRVQKISVLVVSSISLEPLFVSIPFIGALGSNSGVLFTFCF